MMSNPLWGLVLVFFVNPLEPLFPDIGGLTVGRVAGFITMLIWLLHLAQKSSALSKVKNSELLKKVKLFLIPIALSSLFWLFAPKGINALNGAITFTLLAMLGLMVENLTKSSRDLKRILFAIAFSGTIAGLPAILFLFGINLYTAFGATPPIELNAESLRSTTLGGNANSLGIVARNGLFAGFLLLLITKRTTMKVLLWILVLACLSAILLSGSRTNFYGTLIMVFIMIIINIKEMLRTKYKFVLFLMGLISVGIIALRFTPDPIKERLLLSESTKGNEINKERAEDRYEFTKDQQLQALGFLLINPFFGIGVDRTAYYTHSLGAHDTISFLIGETGLLGTIGFSLVVFWALRKLWFIFKRSNDRNQRMGIGLMIGMLLSMIVMGVSGGFIIAYDRTFWVTLGLLNVFSMNIIQNESKQKQNAF